MTVHFFWMKGEPDVCYGCKRSKEECLEEGHVWYLVDESTVVKEYKRNPWSCSHDLFSTILPVQDS